MGCFLCFNEHKGLQALKANSLFPLKEDHSLLADVLGPPAVWESCPFVNLVVTGLLLAACAFAIPTLQDPQKQPILYSTNQNCLRPRWWAKVAVQDARPSVAFMPTDCFGKPAFQLK